MEGYQQAHHTLLARWNRLYTDPSGYELPFYTTALDTRKPTVFSRLTLTSTRVALLENHIIDFHRILHLSAPRSRL